MSKQCVFKCDWYDKKFQSDWTKWIEPAAKNVCFQNVIKI